MNVDTGTLGFVGLIALLAVNRLVLTLAGYGTWRWLFWSIQLLNLLGACGLIVWGLPGMPPGLRLLDFFIALLFCWHIVENNARRVKHLRGDQAQQDESTKSRRDALKAGLRRSAGSEPPEAQP